MVHVQKEASILHLVWIRHHDHLGRLPVSSLGGQKAGGQILIVGGQQVPDSGRGGQTADS